MICVNLNWLIYGLGEILQLCEIIWVLTEFWVQDDFYIISHTYATLRSRNLNRPNQNSIRDPSITLFHFREHSR